MVPNRLRACAFGVVLVLGACTTTSRPGPGPAGGPVSPPAATPESAQAAQSAMNGAGVAALPSASAGYYMDQQEKKLRQQLQRTNVTVARRGDNIILNLPGSVTFASNAADINPDFDATLNAVAAVLKDFDKTVVYVTGHTDAQGSDEYNLGLSQRRANSVAQYLISQGLMAQRLVVQGLGKTQPLESNNSAEGRQANRRVEIKLTPLVTG